MTDHIQRILRHSFPCGEWNCNIHHTTPPTCPTNSQHSTPSPHFPLPPACNAAPTPSDDLWRPSFFYFIYVAWIFGVFENMICLKASTYDYIIKLNCFQCIDSLIKFEILNIYNEFSCKLKPSNSRALLITIHIVHSLFCYFIIRHTFN